VWGHGPMCQRVLLKIAAELGDLQVDQQILQRLIADILDEEGIRGGRRLASR
jgi:hypothetical protein